MAKSDRMKKQLRKELMSAAVYTVEIIKPVVAMPWAYEFKTLIFPLLQIKRADYL